MQNLMQTRCLILPSIADKMKHDVKKTHVKTMRVHSAVSSGRLMEYACGSVTLASPLIFHPGSYNNNIPGTFQYTSYYTHYRNADAPQYICTDSSSLQFKEKMIYDTWHSYIGAPHHVSADVDSEYFGKRK
jgi:hypothetical protein